MYYLIFHTHDPGAAGTENQGSPLGGQNFLNVILLIKVLLKKILQKKVFFLNKKF